MESLLARLLEETREATTRLTAWRRACRGSARYTILGLTAVSIPALAPNTLVVVATPVSLLLLALAARRNGIDARLFHALLYPLAVSTVAAAPLAALGRVEDALLLLYRVVVPAVLAALLVWSVGWLTVIEGLEELGAPRQLTESLLLLSLLVPRFAGQLLAILAARRARHLGSLGYREWWRLQATALGEILIRAMDSAHRLALAVEARSLGGALPRRGRSACSGGTPWLVYASSIVIIAAGVAGYALGY